MLCAAAASSGPGGVAACGAAAGWGACPAAAAGLGARAELAPGLFAGGALSGGSMVRPGLLPVLLNAPGEGAVASSAVGARPLGARPGRAAEFAAAQETGSSTSGLCWPQADKPTARGEMPHLGWAPACWAQELPALRKGWVQALELQTELKAWVLAQARLVGSGAPRHLHSCQQ